MEVGLSLGSNLGDRQANLCRARQALFALDGLHPLGQSALYETEPVDVAPQYRELAYLNAVLVAEVTFPPAELRRRITIIEGELGRTRVPDRHAPRPVDIDLIYAGGMVSTDPELTLPHPRWSERRFVVQPLADVRPELVLPPSEQTVQAVLLALPPTPAVVVFASTW